MWLFRAETIFFPCFFLPPPPLSGQAPVPDAALAPTSVKYPLEATTFVVWGLTFGVISDLAVAGGGRAFAHQGPPYFRCVRPNTWSCLCFTFAWGYSFGGQVLLLLLMCLQQSESPKPARVLYRGV